MDRQQAVGRDRRAARIELELADRSRRAVRNRRPVSCATAPRVGKEAKGTRYNLFPRLSRRKVLHQTDGYLWLVFSAHRSIPAFPTPLRRVIGHHWPWYRLPGPMAFVGTRWRSRAGSRAQMAANASRSGAQRGTP